MRIIIDSGTRFKEVKEFFKHNDVSICVSSEKDKIFVDFHDKDEFTYLTIKYGNLEKFFDRIYFVGYIYAPYIPLVFMDFNET